MNSNNTRLVFSLKICTGMVFSFKKMYMHGLCSPTGFTNQMPISVCCPIFNDTCMVSKNNCHTSMDSHTGLVMTVHAW